MVSGFRQRQVHGTGRLELHGLSPELGADARLLPEDEALGFGVAGAHRGVVGYLQDYISLVLYGLPQGSDLDPILFIFFSNIIYMINYVLDYIL